MKNENEDPKERIIAGVKKTPIRRKPKVLYPEVSVQLTGRDGNAFSIIGEVNRQLRRAGHVEALEPFMAEATAAESYDQFLQVVMKTVSVR